MLSALYSWFYGSHHAIAYSKKDGNHTIAYTMKDGELCDTITIHHNDKRVYHHAIADDILEMDDTVYELTDDMKLRSLRHEGKLLHAHRIGADLNGGITYGTETAVYKDGIILSAIVNNNLYRKLEHGDNPVYLVYTGNGIYVYSQGVYMYVVTGKSRYALIAEGYVLGFMTNLDTNVHVQWRSNADAMLRNIKGYNPNLKKNLLPMHYFNDDLWLLLKKHNIITKYNKDLVLESKTIRHFLSRSLFIAYDELGSVTEIFGYQPLLTISNGNLHGLITLNSEYYYHQGIMQWRRDGNIYIVRYTDDRLIKMTIYSDRVIYLNKCYLFQQGSVTIADDINIIIIYNHGLPLMTTNGKIRNLPPDF